MLSDPTLDTTEVDGLFHLDCSFRVSFHGGAAFRTDALATVVYDNGVEACRAAGVGDQTVHLRSLGAKMSVRL